jgi:hypothetical protein
MSAPSLFFRTSVVVCLALTACRRATPVATLVLPPPPLPTPRVESQWIAAQTTALALIAENRQSAADSVLMRFSRDYARTPEGDRARWWRTLMRADARVGNGDVQAAVTQVDSLLSESVSLDVRTEAVLFRRSLVAVDSLRRLEIRRRTAATQSATDRLDEMKVARDSVTKLKTEIDRLRRRLRAP